MALRRIALLIGCLALALPSYVLLDFWSGRNAPLFKRFERQWREDVELLETSSKLPKQWFDVREFEIIGGTVETKKWLAQVQAPLKSNPNGKHRMDVLVVVWEEEGVRGVTVQYNLEELATKNNISELGRTLILRRPGGRTPWRELIPGLFK
jgi:hypothetical protein